MARPAKWGTRTGATEAVVGDQVALRETVREKRLVQVGEAERAGAGCLKSAGGGPGAGNEREVDQSAGDWDVIRLREGRGPGFPNLPMDGVVRRLMAGFGDDRDAQARPPDRLRQRGGPQSPLPVGKVPYLPRLPEKHIAEMGVEGIQHPGREVVPQKTEHLRERLRRAEAAPGDGVQVRPIHHRTDERKLRGQQGDVAQAAQLVGFARRLQTQPHPQMGDFAAHPVQMLPNAGEDAVGGFVPQRPQMGHHQPGVQLRPQFYGVLHGGAAPLGPLLVGDGERGEVGGVGGEANAPFGGGDGERGAAFFLPREAFGKRQLKGLMAPFRQPVQKLPVVNPGGRHPRIAVTYHPPQLIGTAVRRGCRFG